MFTDCSNTQDTTLAIKCKKRKEKSGLYSADSKSGVSKIAKAHKTLEDRTPSFRPILLAKGIPNYNLHRIMDRFLKPLSRNRYTIKDSFFFSNEVFLFDASFFIASFEKPIFIPLHLTKTLTFCGQNLHINQSHVGKFTRFAAWLRLPYLNNFLYTIKISCTIWWVSS